MKKEVRKSIKELVKGNRFKFVRRHGWFVFDMWSPVYEWGGVMYYKTEDQWEDDVMFSSCDFRHSEVVIVEVEVDEEEEIMLGGVVDVPRVLLGKIMEYYKQMWEHDDDDFDFGCSDIMKSDSDFAVVWQRMKRELGSSAESGGSL